MRQEPLIRPPTRYRNFINYVLFRIALYITNIFVYTLRELNFKYNVPITCRYKKGRVDFKILYLKIWVIYFDKVLN